MPPLASSLGYRNGVHNPFCFSSLFLAFSFAGTYLILESPFFSCCLLLSSTQAADRQALLALVLHGVVKH